MTVWQRYGFSRDPYDSNHLPVEAASIPLFVGRRLDHDRLLGFLRMQETGKVMVQGMAGVGKTSLVNVVQWELFEAGERLPLLDVVETPDGATRELFLLAVLSGLVSTLRQVVGHEEVEAEPAWRVAREAVTRGVRTEFGLKLSAAGFEVGADYGTGPEALGLTAQVLVDLLRDAVAAVQRPPRSFGGVLVPVNNLDTQSLEDMLALLNAIRDVTGMIKGVYWIFIGGAGLFEALEGRARRISESFTANPIALDPLAWQDVVEALERRRQAFALTPDARLPVSERITRLVYDVSGGELRFTFVRLSRTVAEAAVRFPSELALPDELALSLLQDWARGQLPRTPLGEREAVVVEALATHGTLRPKQHEMAGVRTPQQMTDVLGSLVEKGYARVTSEGIARVYRLSSAALLARGGRLIGG